MPCVASCLAAIGAGMRNADVSVQQGAVGLERCAVAFIDNAAALDDDGAIGHAQDLLRVLFNQNCRHALFADDLAQGG